MADDGSITVPSQHGVKDTIDRRETAMQRAGMTVFARIDHTAGATKAGLKLRPPSSRSSAIPMPARR